MKKVILAGLMLAAALGAGSASAQNTQPAPKPTIDQADVFLGVCQREENFDACIMYLSGYTNGVLVQSLIDKQRPRYCVPPNVARREQLGALIAWMKLHLGEILQPTGVVIYKAMLGIYPCR